MAVANLARALVSSSETSSWPGRTCWPTWTYTVLDGRGFGSVRFKDVLRLDPSTGAARLDEVLYLGLGNPQWQLVPRETANTEEDEDESDRGKSPEHTTTDCFSSFFCHSISDRRPVYKTGRDGRLLPPYGMLMGSSPAAVHQRILFR